LIKQQIRSINLFLCSKYQDEEKCLFDWSRTWNACCYWRFHKMLFLFNMMQLLFFRDFTELNFRFDIKGQDNAVYSLNVECLCLFTMWPCDSRGSLLPSDWLDPDDSLGTFPLSDTFSDPLGTFSVSDTLSDIFSLDIDNLVSYSEEMKHKIIFHAISSVSQMRYTAPLMRPP
jgi:hypothetical protein